MSHNTDERARSASIVADVLESPPLPTTVEGHAPTDRRRRRLEYSARELGITPAAILRIRRAD